MALALFAALIYFPGLTRQGLTNWQESVRLVVAREMHQNGEWLVPTRNGEPYLAKPPMIYWVQRVIGLARGNRAFTDEFELRATVALFGVLGVLATYLVGRRLLEDDLAARWGACVLATGLLYVHSARVGELDILLVVFVVTAIGCVVESWRRVDRGGKTAWGAIVLATAMATGAVLTKGPPALLVITIGGSASAVARGVLSSGAKLKRWMLAAAGLLGTATALVVAAPQAHGVGDWVGVVMLACMSGAVLACVAIAAQPTAAGRWWPLVRAGQPWIVLGVPLLAFFGWGRLVAERIGAEKLASLAQSEVEDNLRIFVPESPLNNIGFLSYGLLPLGILGLIGLVHAGRNRVVNQTGVVVVAVWILGGLVAFSTLGKGVARYLTPLWPAVALLAGYLLVWWLRYVSERAARRARVALCLVVLATGIGQLWWYADGRVRYEGDRSPRDLAAAMRRQVEGFDPARCGTFDFESPGLEYYLGREIPDWGESRKRESLNDLRSVVGSGTGAYVLLVRAVTPESLKKYADPKVALAQHGIRVTGYLDVQGLYSRPPRETPVEAWLIGLEESRPNP